MKEGFLANRYETQDTFHLYAAGQLYILSADLVDAVVHEAATGHHKTYIENVEDHDISTMAFHSNASMHFVFISKSDMQFWQHPVKNKPNRPRFRSNWESTWKTAIDHLNATLPYLQP